VPNSGYRRATDRLDLKINMEFRLNPIRMKRGAQGFGCGITAQDITQLPNYMLTALCVWRVVVVMLKAGGSAKIERDFCHSAKSWLNTCMCA
jgi:hypothetical protein